MDAPPAQAPSNGSESRSGRDRDRDRDRDGGSRRDRDRDRSPRRRSRSRSRDRSRRHRSRSRSSDRRRERRKNKPRLWDLPPGAPGLPEVAPPPVAGAAGSSGRDVFGGSLTGVNPVMQSQASRQARRLYVGGLPPTTREDDLKAFFNAAMQTACPGEGSDFVVSVYLNLEKKFGFVEFKTTGEATAALKLDGIAFNGITLKIKRPSDYQPPTPDVSTFNPLLGMLGGVGVGPGAMPGQHVPDLDVSRLGIISTQVPDGPNKVFCGGLPYDLSEVDVKQLIGAYGQLKAFHMVKDRDTNQSKGYCFFEYADPNITDIAISGLNGIQIGNKTLTVRRSVPKDGQGGAMPMGLPGLGLPGMLGGLPGVSLPMGMPGLGAGLMQQPTRVLVLLQMVTPEELADDQEYKDIKEDIELECGRYGQVLTLILPKPNEPGCGKVFVEYAQVDQAQKARAELQGRQFANRLVVCEFMDEGKFARRELA